MRYGLIAGAIIGVIVGGMFQQSWLMIPSCVVGALLGFGVVLLIAYDPWNLVGRERVGAYRYPKPAAAKVVRLLFWRWRSSPPSPRTIWNDPAYIAKFNSIYGSNDQNNEPIING